MKLLINYSYNKNILLLYFKGKQFIKMIILMAVRYRVLSWNWISLQYLLLL